MRYDFHSFLSQPIFRLEQKQQLARNWASEHGAAAARQLDQQVAALAEDHWQPRLSLHVHERGLAVDRSRIFTRSAQDTCRDVETRSSSRRFACAGPICL